MVTSKGIAWPQVRDADEALSLLFNIKGKSLKVACYCV